MSYWQRWGHLCTFIPLSKAADCYCPGRERQSVLILAGACNMPTYGERSMSFKILLTHIFPYSNTFFSFLFSSSKSLLKYYKYIRSIEINKMKSALPPALWNFSILSHLLYFFQRTFYRSSCPPCSPPHSHSLPIFVSQRSSLNNLLAIVFIKLLYFYLDKISTYVLKVKSYYF